MYAAAFSGRISCKFHWDGRVLSWSGSVSIDARLAPSNSMDSQIIDEVEGFVHDIMYARARVKYEVPRQADWKRLQAHT